MTGGQVTLPVTIRMSNGAGAGFAAQHSQPVENWFLNVPGLKLAVPGTPADAYGLLRAAIRDENPVLVFEHKNLFNLKGELPESPQLVELGVAEVARPGEHVTVVAMQMMRHRALEAAEVLAGEGIEVEVIDPRTLIPFDYDTVATSLDRTGRLVVVQESPDDGSWGASLVARLVGDRLEHFDAPPLLVGSDETPVPYAAPLEERWIPSVERIVEAVKRTVSY
jgi:pyruvate dehydrogenase E1 component beta subunit